MYVVADLDPHAPRKQAEVVNAHVIADADVSRAVQGGFSAEEYILSKRAESELGELRVAVVADRLPLGHQLLPILRIISPIKETCSGWSVLNVGRLRPHEERRSVWGVGIP